MSFDPGVGGKQGIGSQEQVGVPKSLEYYASLDGLRGVALVAILFYHSGVNWIPGGFLSVSTFFTLSGFLITSLLLYEWDAAGRIDLRAFWVRRLRRLMPGAILALLVVALFGSAMGDESQLQRLTGDGIAALRLQDGVGHGPAFAVVVDGLTDGDRFGGRRKVEARQEANDQGHCPACQRYPQGQSIVTHLSLPYSTPYSAVRLRPALSLRIATSKAFTLAYQTKRQEYPS